jgi:hypothetical protein
MANAFEIRLIYQVETLNSRQLSAYLLEKKRKKGGLVKK